MMAGYPYVPSRILLEFVTNSVTLPMIFLKDVFYLFIFRERGRKGERERNINVWLLLTHPSLGT